MSNKEPDIRSSVAYPDVKGFSSRNLWYMKQWYIFYSGFCSNEKTAPTWYRNGFTEPYRFDYRQWRDAARVWYRSLEAPYTYRIQE